MKNKKIFSQYIFGIAIYCMFSFSSVAMKYASFQTQLKYKLLFYILSLGILGFFSILWQILLKKMDLNKAYFFKATTIIWGMIFGYCFFQEIINFKMILGMFITTIGMIIILGEREDE